MLLKAAFLCRFSKTWIESPLGKALPNPLRKSHWPVVRDLVVHKAARKANDDVRSRRGGTTGYSAVGRHEGKGPSQLRSTEPQSESDIAQAETCGLPKSSDDSRRRRGCGTFVRKGGGAKAFSSKAFEVLRPGRKSTPSVKSHLCAFGVVVGKRGGTGSSNHVLGGLKGRWLSLARATTARGYLLGRYLPPGNKSIPPAMQRSGLSAALVMPKSGGKSAGFDARDVRLRRSTGRSRETS